MQLRCDRWCDAFHSRVISVHHRPKVGITHAVRIMFRKERIALKKVTLADGQK